MEELQRAQQQHAKNLEAVHQTEQEVARLLREMREREAAARQLQRMGRGMVARRDVQRKVAQREKAATDISRIARGRQGRQRVQAINLQRKKMGLAPRRTYEGEPEGVDGWQVGQEEPDEYGDDDFDVEDGGAPMSEEQAALKIQCSARGMLGRRRAQKQVKPFELSIGGFDFSHRGGQKSVGDSVVFSQFGFYAQPNARGTSGTKKERIHAPHHRPTMAELRQQQLFHDPDDEELATFHVIDGDGDGFISVEDLAEYLDNIGEHPPHIDLKELIRELDTEKNGKVSQDEFIAYMREMRQQDKDDKRKSVLRKQIDSKTRRAYLIGRLNGEISNKNPLNQDILPVKKKRPVEPVQIGFD